MQYEVIPAPQGEIAGTPTDERVFGPGCGPGCETAAGPCADDCMAACGPMCGPCGPCGSCGHHCGWLLRELFHSTTIFAGIHGFKGPSDLGRNGNFGFQEGLNFGGPLGDPWGVGYQIGFQVAHSDFSGNQVVLNQQGQLLTDTSPRNQLFFTAGIFRRAQCDWLQWGVVFDWFHDSYYDTADLRQIRQETSIFLNGIREIGYMGAYGVGGDTFSRRLANPLHLEPTDMFAVFYRRHFSGGGVGRLWAGVAGHGHGLIGGEITIPLGTSWAWENNFAYVIPKHGAGADGLSEESWSVNIRLVWYPGRTAVSAINSPFHPLFRVADNSAFMVERQ